MKPNFSEKAVLSLLCVRMQVSIPEVAKQFGIPAPTVVGIINRLQQKGLVKAGPTVSAGRGRPLVTYLLRLPKPTAVLLFDGTRIAGAVFDEELKIKSLKVEDFLQAKTFEDVAPLVRKHLEDIFSESSVNREDISEIAIVLNAICLGNRVLESSVLPWAHDLLEESFSAALGLPARFIPPRALLLAEYQQMPKPLPQSMVRFSVGNGISANVLVNQQIYQGISFRAGQLGHITLERNGPLCGCGRRGCLESYCNGPAIQRRVLEALKLGVSNSVDQEELKNAAARNAIDLIWRAWNEGDSLIRGCMEEIFDNLGWALGLVMNMLDPEVVVFSAYVLNNKPEWVEEIISRSQRWTLDSTQRNTRFETSETTLEDELRAVACCTNNPSVLSTAEGEE